VSVRIRGTRRPHGVRNVPEAADDGNTVDGTACMPQVGRP
jgi:hypothetical protein